MENNGYKIRFDLLAMAKDILMEEWHRKCQANEQEYYQQVGIQDQTQSSVIVPYPQMPPAPGSKDIIGLAQQLNDFVSRR